MAKSKSTPKDYDRFGGKVGLRPLTEAEKKEGTKAFKRPPKPKTKLPKGK